MRTGSSFIHRCFRVPRPYAMRYPTAYAGVLRLAAVRLSRQPGGTGVARCKCCNRCRPWLSVRQKSQSENGKGVSKPGFMLALVQHTLQRSRRRRHRSPGDDPAGLFPALHLRRQSHVARHRPNALARSLKQGRGCTRSVPLRSRRRSGRDADVNEAGGSQERTREQVQNRFRKRSGS
jgi:hypothetical protein